MTYPRGIQHRYAIGPMWRVVLRRCTRPSYHGNFGVPALEIYHGVFFIYYPAHIQGRIKGAFLTRCNRYPNTPYPPTTITSTCLAQRTETRTLTGSVPTDTLLEMASRTATRKPMAAATKTLSIEFPCLSTTYRTRMTFSQPFLARLEGYAASVLRFASIITSNVS